MPIAYTPPQLGVPHHIPPLIGSDRKCIVGGEQKLCVYISENPHFGPVLGRFWAHIRRATLKIEA